MISSRKRQYRQYETEGTRILLNFPTIIFLFVCPILREKSLLSFGFTFKHYHRYIDASSEITSTPFPFTRRISISRERFIEELIASSFPIAHKNSLAMFFFYLIYTRSRNDYETLPPRGVTRAEST